MKSNPMNKTVTLTAKERDQIVEKLKLAGIDKELLAKVFDYHQKGRDDCQLFIDKCGDYFNVDPGTMGMLKKALEAKKIDIKNLDPVVRKLF
ncbi:hypothetical protein [Butyrivibrio sp. MC2013]|uniref:hypothetical protein n=1 Tax=Butyrivibrio sp. MC2013 TaxID=1280686 RepID=UPI00047BA0DB|nr:hypothetical protein [Butyrivibrio sp. MC2013]